MKRVLVVMVVVVLALVMAQTAFAQEEPEIGLGTRVISLSGSYQLDRDNAWRVAAGYGQFITEKAEVGGVIDYAGADGVDSSGFVGAYGRYHFISDVPSNTVPYLGLVLGISDSGGDSGFGWGAQAGVDMFLSAKQSIFAEYSYFDDENDNSSSINFGLRMFL